MSQAARRLMVVLFGSVAAGGLPALAADLRPRLVIVEGEASVIDGTRRVAAAEGLRVGPGSLIDTGPRAVFVRIEWPDGQAVDLGQDTRAMLAPTGFGPRDKASPAVYLLSGWAKLSSVARPRLGLGGMVTPGLELAPFNGGAVVWVGADNTVVFAETGAMQLQERRGKTATRFSLKSGESYAKAGSGAGAVSAAPTPEVLRRMPRGFRDTLPLRWARFEDADVQASPQPPASYAELAPWLVAEPALRRDFPKRFAARAREPAFRADLMGQLAAHTEWTPVLYPPPPPSATPSTPPSPPPTLPPQPMRTAPSAPR